MTATLSRLSVGARLCAGIVLLGLASLARATLPIESWNLPNGARVLFVENRALPMIDVSVDLPAGYARDTAETSGRAAMALSMMRLGAGGMPETGIAAGLADVGAQMSTRFDADRAGYALRTLSAPSERERALELLATVLQAPDFPPEVLEREKARVMANLKEAAMKPESLAERAFSAAIYQDHPYGLRGVGEIGSVAALTPEDLRSHYTRWFRSDWAVVAIMGDVSREEADGIARRLTGSLPRADGPVEPLPIAGAVTAAVERFIEHPASQSHILVGQPAMARNDPDYFPLFVGNYVLGGGGFSSRLVDEIRQKRGLAYSSYSAFMPSAAGGVFQIGLQTRKDQAAQALEVVRSTLRAYVESGPSEQELAAAKLNLVGGFPLRIDSNKKIHDYLGLMGFYGLPLDYLDRFVENIEAVTRDQIRDAFRRRIDPDRLVTVVVGAVAPGR